MVAGRLAWLACRSYVILHPSTDNNHFWDWMSMPDPLVFFCLITSSRLYFHWVSSSGRVYLRSLHGGLVLCAIVTAQGYAICLIRAVAQLTTRPNRPCCSAFTADPCCGRLSGFKRCSQWSHRLTTVQIAWIGTNYCSNTKRSRTDNRLNCVSIVWSYGCLYMVHKCLEY